MKQNKYDDPEFFATYAQMPRSIRGLEVAGEWHSFQRVLPDFQGKRVLDVGAGYGWHCRYAAEHGAKSVIGTDISAKMLEKARQLNSLPNVRYEQAAAEDLNLAPASVDVVLSSLMFHYVRDLHSLFANIATFLVSGGRFCYSIEHPVITAFHLRDWAHSPQAKIVHWPIENYFHEGERKSHFLGAEMTKYHRTIGTHFAALLESGFVVDNLIESIANLDVVKKAGWRGELRQPMVLIISATKK